MKVPLRWLRDFVEISMSAEEIGHRLTMAGTEVGSVHHVGTEWSRIIIGRVMQVERHSGADNLFVARVNIGAEGTITLVTAAPNLEVGFVVPVVRPGGSLDAERKIDARKFRGILSEGMLCSGAELGVSSDDHQIYVLESDAPVGVQLVDYLADDVLDIELTTNRPDNLGVIGIAREISAITGAPLRIPWENDAPPTANGVSPLRVSVDAPDLCPRYTGRYLENITIAPSPQWMQRRLHLAGVRPISNVVDVTNYVMLELGQPLHAFDATRLTDNTIRVRRAHAGEKITTIDGAERVLTTDMLVIADAAIPVALAGVMGGEDSEITDASSRVVLESATFDGKSIRLTSRDLRLQTEASKRFDKGLDVELSARASDRAVALLSQLAGARPVGPMIDVRTAVQPPRQIAFGSADITKLIGHEYEDEQIRGILGRLGFGLTETAEGLIARVPTWRRDVEGKADIAEEVARIVGYEVIPARLPSGQLPSTYEDPSIRWEAVIRSALAAAGLQEVITYSLVDPYVMGRLDPSSSYPNAPADENTIPIYNPQIVERSRLRRTLLPSLLNTVSGNLRHESRIAIFELAHVFIPPMDPLPREERRLTIAMAGRRIAADWNAEAAEVDFYDLKAAIEAVFEVSHLQLILEANAGEPWLHPGRSATIKVAGSDAPIGFMGQVHPTVAERFDIEDTRVYAAEIEINALLTQARDELTIRSIPRFPAVTRDLALLVDQTVTHAAMAGAIAGAAGTLLEKLTLFDVYHGAGIPEGQVSLAYSMTLRAPDRTLEDQDVNTVMKAIEKRVVEGLGARVRGR